MNTLASQLKSINRKNVKSFFVSNAIYIVLFALFAVIVIINPSFLSLKNFGFILSQSATRMIFACAIAGPIVLGGTDLSAGRLIGFAGLLSASLLQSPDYAVRVFPNLPRLPIWLPILLAMLMCAVFSLIGGYLVAKLKVAPFIASLGMQLVVYGLMSVYFDAVSDSAPIGVLDEKFSSFAQNGINIFGFRLQFIILYAVAVVAIVWFIWNKTKLGKNMFAIGGNIEAANVSGVNIVFNMLAIYMLAGLLYGFGGALEVARTGSATNALGQGYELDAIAACVVGGVSMRGGVGKIKGIITGVLLFQVISYGLVYIQVNPYLVYFVKGAIILIAVVIDTKKYIKKK
ncbi:MAG TPA: galactose/methyl galactoside ABC transporter permease MglC [Ruminiclostridium sp.]|nr:galactose/methyl galactoside ABC transporter permease MglC [Ruminiclostridium sp.]